MLRCRGAVCLRWCSAASWRKASGLLAFADSGARLSGVLIPEAAIIMSDGKIWCYVAEAKGSFGRRLVDMTRPLPGGYFAGQGFRAGEAVVTQGQSLLLAYEINPEGGEAE